MSYTADLSIRNNHDDVVIASNEQSQRNSHVYGKFGIAYGMR